MAVINLEAKEYAEKRRELKVNKKLRSLFITLPQRDNPTPDIPYGPMAVMTYLQKNGYTNTYLYHLDLVRPTREEALDYIQKFNPDILCISAPVSTSYDNCKFYTLELKKRLPQMKIIIGGNMAASAEILLKRTGVDICVTGEGETAALKLFDQLSIGNWVPHKNYHDIKGLAFLDEKGEMINTGNAEQLPADQVFDVDWNLLDEQSVKHCFLRIGDVDPKTNLYRYLAGPMGTIPPELNDKTVGQMALSKGCVARCTFCHRFQKGIRYVPVDICISRMKRMMDQLNVGFFQFGDECFGADLRWLDEFLIKVKDLNVHWEVAGMRVKQITTELIERMKAAGCTSVIYGMETGSERMIEIMEKRASVEDNKRAFKITLEADLFTIPQLIIGMPGETFETIQESTQFIVDNMTIKPYQNPRDVSINHAQALPGTPLYEFARYKNIIGKSFEEEEQYLMDISDRNANDEETTLNFTDYPMMARLSWVALIKVTLNYAYYKKWGKKHYEEVMFKSQPPALGEILKNRKFTLMYERYPRLFYHLRHFMWFFKLLNFTFKYGFKRGLKAAGELAVWGIKRLFKKEEQSIKEYKSLRHIVEKDLSGALSGAEAMVPLRKGR